MHLELWQAYLISTAIGLLIGIEREKSHPNGQSMGVRTFVLIALLGAVAGGLEKLWISALISAFCFVLIALSYFNMTRAKQRPDIGLTTEFAAGIVFALGFLSHTRPVLISVLGPAVATVLFAKAPLHSFTRQIKKSEMQAALLLLLVGVIVVNLLDDRVIDPWGIFNPRKFGILILVLAALEFGSYILSKVLGQKSGSMVLGFVGGLVSSTAVMLSSAKMAAKTPSAWRSRAISAIAAKLAALMEAALILAMVSTGLFVKLILPLGGCFLVGAGALVLLTFRSKDQKENFELRSPLDWRGIIRLAVLLGILLGLIAIVRRSLGESATLAVTFLGGLFELHGITLANATMFASDQLSLESAIYGILVAVTASLVAKIFIAWMTVRNSFSTAITVIFISMIAALWALTLA